MSSFSQDEKWMEAKQAVGHMNWLEVISYYRSIGGGNVSVYAVVDGEKLLIIDILDDESILLLDKDGYAKQRTYDSVLQSRKIFQYSESSVNNTMS